MLLNWRLLYLIDYRLREEICKLIQTAFRPVCRIQRNRVFRGHDMTLLGRANASNFTVMTASEPLEIFLHTKISLTSAEKLTLEGRLGKSLGRGHASNLIQDFLQDCSQEYLQDCLQDTVQETLQNSLQDIFSQYD